MFAVKDWVGFQKLEIKLITKYGFAVIDDVTDLMVSLEIDETSTRILTTQYNIYLSILGCYIKKYS